MPVPREYKHTTNAIQIQRAYHTNGVQMQYKYNINTIQYKGMPRITKQLPCKYRRNTIHTFKNAIQTLPKCNPNTT